MENKINIGIIICDRYKTCGGGKCFKAMQKREGAFDIYKNQEISLVGYTTCGGCPGGNIEYAPEEMKKNGANIIHLATGFVVGFPPCHYTKYFKDFIEEKFQLKVVVGTHPIPEKYYFTHSRLNSWDTYDWKELIGPALSSKKIRTEYN